MLAQVHRLRFCAIAILLQMAFTATEARAGAWSDYVEAASAIVDADNRRLNAELRPASSAAVRVLVEVRQTGAIKELKVIESSGSEDLDAAALESLGTLAELPTPPASVYFKQFFTPLIFTYSFDREVARPVYRQPDDVAQSAEQRPADAAANPVPAEPNEVILALQSALIQAGYDPGPVDGFYGNVTADAIRAFQRDQGLTVNGVPTAALVNVIKDVTDEVTAEADAVAPVQTGTTDEAGNQGQSSDFTPPKSGAFSLNRELVEDYEYLGDRQLEDY